MKIYLIRHSESQDDFINCYGGMADWDLTDGGTKTVEEFRAKFESFGIEKIYSSPLRRAFKTAILLNKNIQVPLEKVFELHETPHYGYMTGLEKNMANYLFSYLLDRPECQNTGYYNRRCHPGGETPEDLDKRVERTINQILENGNNLNTIAIVTHGGVIRSFFWDLLKDKRKISDIKDVAFAEIILDNGKLELIQTKEFKFE